MSSVAFGRWAMDFPPPFVALAIVALPAAFDTLGKGCTGRRKKAVRALLTGYSSLDHPKTSSTGQTHGG